MDKNTILTLKTGETGTFIRYYGKKVQIRTDSGKVTGEVQEAPVVEPEPKPVARRTGSVQERILDQVRKQPEISYRELGLALGISTPRAATCMKSLITSGRIVKTAGEGGKNRYEIV